MPHIRKQFSTDGSTVYMELISQISTVNIAFRHKLHQVFVIGRKQNGCFLLRVKVNFFNFFKERENLKERAAQLKVLVKTKCV